MAKAGAESLAPVQQNPITMKANKVISSHILNMTILNRQLSTRHPGSGAPFSLSEGIRKHFLSRMSAFGSGAPSQHSEWIRGTASHCQEEDGHRDFHILLEVSHRIAIARNSWSASKFFKTLAPIAVALPTTAAT